MQNKVGVIKLHKMAGIQLSIGTKLVRVTKKALTFGELLRYNASSTR